MPVSFKEAINRGNNLLAVGFLAATAIGVVELAISEDEWSHRIDDILVVLIAVIGVIWYLINKNAYRRSWVPLILVAAGFVLKVIAIAVEFNDVADVGDDFGVTLSFLTMLVIEGYVFYRTRQVEPGPGAGPIH